MKNNYEIWTDGLTKIYNKGPNQTTAVDHINLRFESGIHGFLGPNGAGKTTTISMLMGTIFMTEGEAYIRGIKAGTKLANEMIGFLPQDPIFYGNMTACDYLMFTGRLYGLKKNYAKNKALELIDYFKLSEEKKKLISKYSGGMRQKVGLASTLIHDPKLLILDEPTTNLDPLGRMNLISYIKQLSKNMSIFISSHILSEIEQLCREVTIIDRGKIISTDTISNIKKLDLDSPSLYILDTNSNSKVVEELTTTLAVSKVWLNAEDNKIHIISNNDENLQKIVLDIINKKKLVLKSFHQPETSLQDIFIKLIDKKGEK